MTVAFGVSAADEQTIFVSGGDNGVAGVVLKSTDGGQSWNSMPRDPQMMYLSVDAGSDTFAVAGSLGFYGQVAVGSATTNGETLQGLPFVPLFSGCQSVTAASPNDFYLVGFWFNVREAGEGVFASHDAGQTLTFHPWNSVGVQPRYGDFPSNKTWYLAGGLWPAEKGYRDSEIIQLSHRIQLRKGPDGSIAFEINEDISKMPKNGYLAIIERSLDGGVTFETVFNESNRRYFNGIDCLDEARCWVTAEGPEGAWILKTEDYGRTWVEQLFLADRSLIDVQMLDANEGWAVGGEILSNTFNALFIHTMDGGKTWLTSNTINNAYPNAISVVSSNRAFATAFMRNGLSSILVYH